MKRFWSEVTVVRTGLHHAVLLDGRPMRLPNGPALHLTSAALAAAIAAEWSAAGGGAGGEFSLAEVNLTRLAGTAQAQIAPDPGPAMAAIAAYAQTDLLCYRADTPPGLADRQHERWQPWLDWAAHRYGAPLLVTAGIGHVAQPAASLGALRDAVGQCDAFALTGLGIIVPALGSLVLGLAVLEAAMPAGDAFDLSILDEMFQEQRWGTDRDALARRALVRHDVMEAARFMELARG